MGKLYTAYFYLTITSIDSNNIVHQVKKSNKISSYITKEIITCQHVESFAIYSHPQANNIWEQLIKTELQTSGLNILTTGVKINSGTMSQIGTQYGSQQNSIYITVYDTGTVNIQGLMAVQFALENAD